MHGDVRVADVVRAASGAAAGRLRAPEKSTAPALLPGAVALHGLYGVSVCGGEAGCDVRPARGAGLREREVRAQRSEDAELSVEMVVAQ